MTTPTLSLRKITKSFGHNEILKPLSLEVSKGEFLVLVGPSGCGKSTLLRIIAGLEKPDQGEILINGFSVNEVEPRDRNLAMVFQNYALYPHLKVRDNLEFGIRLRKVPEHEIKRRVQNTSEMLGLISLLDRYPRELSGGQRQRVALGRALVRECPLILFDEPLSNLDAHLRSQMRVEIKALHNRLGNTIIYVTHDQVEATTMGDRIAVLNEGRLAQIDDPRSIYQNPNSRFVASFIGSPEINFCPIQTFVSGHSEKGQLQGWAGVRPEKFILNQGELTGKITMMENLGPHQLVHFDYKGQNLRALTKSTEFFTVGSTFNFAIPQDQILYFDQNGGRIHL